MLKPKCLISDKKGEHQWSELQCLGHSAEGYLTPCCFIDAHTKDRGMANNIFYQEKFKISNVENIKNITQSQEWIDFYTMLIETPSNAPSVCHIVCGSDAKIGDKYV